MGLNDKSAKSVAVIYTRVSTSEQIDNLSLEVQEQSCRQYCQTNGIEVSRLFAEMGQSAKTLDRTELAKMLLFCEENKGTLTHVVVHRLDRLARNTHVHMTLAARLGELGIRLVSCSESIDETAAGRFIEGIFSSLAAFDHEIHRERTRAGLHAAKQRGRWPHLPPLGYLPGLRKSDSMRVHVKIARRIQESFELAAKSKQDLAGIMRTVTERGLRSRNGRVLTLQQFKRLLRNPMYCGLLRLESGEFIEGDWEPLIEVKLFLKVNPSFRSHGAPKAA